MKTILSEVQIEIKNYEYDSVDNINLTWDCELIQGKAAVEVMPKNIELLGNKIYCEVETRLSEDHYDIVNEVIDVSSYEIKIEVESLQESAEFAIHHLDIDVKEETLTYYFGGI